MNIIIPIGGVGKRFSQDKYSFPKPLIRTLGETLITKCIKSLSITNEDTVYIIYRKEFDSYNFQSVLVHEFRDINFKFIPINFDTRGASETILQCLIDMSPKELDQLTIAVDSDNLYQDNIIDIAKEMNGNTIFYHESLEEKPLFSYIKLDETNKVVEIKEKVKISNNACIGAYCFKSASLLKDTIMDMIKIDDKTQNEFYVSNVYKKLIEAKQIIFSHKVYNYICLGTPEQLKISSSNIIKASKKFRFCFDLDNTLVSYPEIKGDYSSVKPIERNINYLKFLHNQGHEIIIHTARRMKTHGGSVGKLQADIGRITFDTLEKFEIPYDEIYFGKPYADFYIDDLAINAYSDLEKETGFYNIHPDARSYNNIEIKDDVIIKTSTQIEGEKYFYLNKPDAISKYFPTLLSSTDNSITLSKIKGIPLSYLNTNQTLSNDLISKLLESIKEIHESKEFDNGVNIYNNYLSKLEERVSKYDFSSYKNFDKVYDKVKSCLSFYEKNSLGQAGVIHGDPVFTNILLDSNNNFYFIDMRGKVGDDLTIYGDIFYDYAKIYQSIIGYDYVLMDKQMDLNYINQNKQYFEQYILKNYGALQLENIKQITISLIISLIPIHNNSKCKSFYNLIKII